MGRRGEMHEAPLSQQFLPLAYGQQNSNRRYPGHKQVKTLYFPCNTLNHRQYDNYLLISLDNKRSMPFIFVKFILSMFKLIHKAKHLRCDFR